MSANSANYAVIFTSQRSDADAEGYERKSDRMVELARKQPGFVHVESARGADGFGITVSYWASLEAIQSWKNQSEHLAAQKMGKQKWYKSFTIRVCRVER